MRKFCAVMIAAAIFLMLTGCLEGTQLVAQTAVEVSTSSQPEEPPTIAAIQHPECSSAAVYSLSDERYLYADRIGDRVATASLGKLMTAVTALTYMSEDTIITAGTEIWLVQPYSSLCGIQIGSTAPLHDFLEGMLICSGNDAAYTVAVSVSRDISGNSAMIDTDASAYFCRLMNSLAASIGMENSSFSTPDGYDDPMQFSTADDLVKLSKYALTFPTIREICAKSADTVRFCSGEVFEWQSSNLLLDTQSRHFDSSCRGLKTGTTADAGYCLIALFDVGGHELLTIVMGCDSDDDRYVLTKKLIGEASDFEK